MASAIPRREGLSPDRFAREYLMRVAPVVVTDALTDWQARQWTPDHLRRWFGQVPVKLQGDRFEYIAETTLGQFIDQLDGLEKISGPRPAKGLPYLRVDQGPGSLTELILRHRADHWRRPYFLPEAFYFYPPDRISRPNERRYPSFGLYLSPRGARSALHHDEYMTDAVLCQLLGEKRCYLFHPRQTSLVRGRPIEQILGDDRIETFVTDLRAGDVLYIPGPWHHEVHTLSTSISLTYNFVHLLRAASWLDRMLAQSEPVRQGHLRRDPMLARWLDESRALLREAGENQADIAARDLISRADLAGLAGRVERLLASRNPAS